MNQDMSSEIESQKLNAFVDGELDVLSQREIEERMKHDAGLRARVSQLRHLRATVRDSADYHVAPGEFRQRIAALVSMPEHSSKGRSLVKTTLHHWLAWRPIAVSFAAAAVALVIFNGNLTRWRPGYDDRLEEEVLASHVRSTLGQHLVDIASSDHHTVKPWLSSKLGFSPAIQESLLPGSVFLGGRVDYLDGRPVAALVYRQGEHVVNSFVWPTNAGSNDAAFTEKKGFQIAHWSRNGMNHWVISDVNREEFGALVHALEASVPNGQ